MKNNIATLTGRVISDFELSHSAYGEKFYYIHILTERDSGNVDDIRVMVSDKLVDVTQKLVNQKVIINGELRSYDKIYDGRKHLLLFLHAQDIQIFDDMQSGLEINTFELFGNLCRKPTYRITPNNREITDLTLAVKRKYARADFIPCIAWGKNARLVSQLDKNTNVKIVGRMQSREYEKNGETRTVYEISITTIDVAESEDK